LGRWWRERDREGKRSGRRGRGWRRTKGCEFGVLIVGGAWRMSKMATLRIIKKKVRFERGEIRSTFTLVR